MRGEMFSRSRLIFCLETIYAPKRRNGFDFLALWCHLIPILRTNPIYLGFKNNKMTRISLPTTLVFWDVMDVVDVALNVPLSSMTLNCK